MPAYLALWPGRFIRMMPPLVLNIIGYQPLVAGAHGYRAITTLPLKGPGRRFMRFVYRPRRTAFHRFHEIRNRNCARQVYQQMNVVFNTSESMDSTFQLLTLLPYEHIRMPLDFVLQQRLPVPCRPNKMV